MGENSTTSKRQIQIEIFLISLLISRRSSFYDYMVIWYINIIADFKSTIYIIQLLLH